MESHENKPETAVMLAAGAATTEPRRVDADASPYLVTPIGWQLTKLEETLSMPTRKRGKVLLDDAASFVGYFNAHSRPNSAIYLSVDYDKAKATLVGVLNDHRRGLDIAGWRDHLAIYALRPSYEWTEWLGKNKVQLSQAAFAEYIEASMGDIVTLENMPTAAEMLQMAMNFEATQDKRFKKRVNLQSGGISLEFADQDNAETVSRMALFDRFSIGIPVFGGEPGAYPIQARLRYRQNGDKLTFWYELIRPDRVYRQAVADMLASIRDLTPDTPIFLGSMQ